MRATCCVQFVLIMWQSAQIMVFSFYISSFFVLPLPFPLVTDTLLSWLCWNTLNQLSDFFPPHDSSSDNLIFLIPYLVLLWNLIIFCVLRIINATWNVYIHTFLNFEVCVRSDSRRGRFSTGKSVEKYVLSRIKFAIILRHVDWYLVTDCLEGWYCS